MVHHRGMCLVQSSILFKEPIPPRRLNPRLHRDLETILLHALEKDPDRRYATPGELAADHVDAQPGQGS